MVDVISIDVYALKTVLAKAQDASEYSAAYSFRRATALQKLIAESIELFEQQQRSKAKSLVKVGSLLET